MYTTLLDFVHCVIVKRTYYLVSIVRKIINCIFIAIYKNCAILDVLRHGGTPLISTNENQTRLGVAAVTIIVGRGWGWSDCPRRWMCWGWDHCRWARP